MQDCIFCRIVSGELPSYKVYEDDGFLGFLDIHPLRKGHSLLIPKKHVRWVYDVEDFGGYWERAKKISRSILSELEPLWIQFFTHGEVSHAHIHIIPRYEDVGKSEVLPSWSHTLSLGKEEMERIAKTIRHHIK